MKTEEVNKLKVESAQKSIALVIENLVQLQENVLFLKNKLEALAKKSTLSEDEKKKKSEHESNIKHFKERVEENEKHIEILRSLIETYTTNNTYAKMGVK